MNQNLADARSAGHLIDIIVRCLRLFIEAQWAKQLSLFWSEIEVPVVVVVVVVVVVNGSTNSRFLSFTRASPSRSFSHIKATLCSGSVSIALEH